MARLLRLTTFLAVFTIILSITIGSWLIRDADAQGGAIPIDNIIVIYLENHSFDNLYGLFPGAEGLARAANALPQTDLNGVPFGTLPQPINTNLSPPVPDV